MDKLKGALISHLMVLAIGSIEKFERTKNLPSKNNYGCYTGRVTGIANQKRLAKKMKNKRKAKKNG